MAMPKCNAQKASFKAFSDKQIKHVTEWKLMVKKWESDQSQPNPYEIPKSDTGGYVSKLYIFASTVVIPRQIGG